MLSDSIAFLRFPSSASLITSLQTGIQSSSLESASKAYQDHRRRIWQGIQKQIPDVFNLSNHLRSDGLIIIALNVKKRNQSNDVRIAEGVPLQRLAHFPSSASLITSLRP
eukprot:759218-Hanusia_phi.AAC.1